MWNSRLLLTHCNSHFLPSARALRSKTSLAPPTSLHHHQRSYASVNGNNESNWPEPNPPNSVPTPYEIFNQKKGSKYSKKRFYELVKLYHPDKHDNATNDGLTPAIRLERYRLVVAANEILSDPVKANAYDRYGAGWVGRSEIGITGHHSNSSTIWEDYHADGWKNDGIHRNATWEDWERWYQRDKGKQEPRFFSNSTFVSLIIIFAAIGGVGQATRAENYSMAFLEQRDALHTDVSRDLLRRRKETTTAYNSRDERIQSFLDQRGPYGNVTRGSSEHREMKLLPAPFPAPEAGQDKSFRSKSFDTAPKSGG